MFVVCVVVYMMCTLFWYVAVLGGVCRCFAFSSRCFSCYVGVVSYMMCTLFSMSAFSVVCRRFSFSCRRCRFI